MTDTLDRATGPDFAALVTAASGPVHLPGAADWDRARCAWNLAADQRPGAVAEVSGPADVAAVVAFARAQGLSVAPQGTGHGAGPLALDGDTILLRTTGLADVAVDAARRVAVVGAGAQWGQVIAAAQPAGLTPLAGSAADVGVAGYMLGGGLSWFARGRGLACHGLLAAEVVTGAGEVLQVDDHTHPELMWALRGAGGSAGCVVTSLTIELHPVEQVYAGMMFYPIDRAREVLRAYAAWSAGLPGSATTAARLLRMPPLPEIPEPFRGRAFVGVDGAVDAPEAEAQELLAPLRALGPEIDTFAPMPAAGLPMINLDPPGPVPGIGDGINLAALDDATIEAVLRVAGPDAQACPLLLVDLRHLGGALARPGARSAALPDLDGAYAVYTVGIAPVPEAAGAVSSSIAELRTALAPWRAQRDFLNFRETHDEPGRLLPGESLSRLAAVRAQYDPDAVITGHHTLA